MQKILKFGKKLGQVLGRTKFTSVVDGAYAMSSVSYALTESCFIYPITPSTPMAENMDQFNTEERENIFGQEVKVIEMQSEGGVAGAVHGGLQGGGLISTFTASQGLLLMIPNMYKIAGELLPGVFHVASRAVGGQAISIFNDHGDVMACRETGFCILGSSSVQEVHDFALTSHLCAIKSSLPFMHFCDGFRTSHEVNKIEMLDYDEIRSLVDYSALRVFRNRALTPEDPHMCGSVQDGDIFFQMNELSNSHYDAIPDIVTEVFGQIEAVTGRGYKIFDYYGHEEAEHVIVIMGSHCVTVEEAVHHLMEKSGEKVGVVKVRLFRPWSAEHFLEVLPKSVKKISVLDKTKEPGSIGEPLFLDVVSTIHQHENYRNIDVYGGRYGLGGREFTPSMVGGVFDNMMSSTSKERFVIGIDEDVTNLSIPWNKCAIKTNRDVTQCIFFGVGGDGTVGANREAIQIIGNNTDMSCQGYFDFDAKKTGGKTISHLRFGKNKIESPYFVKEADYIACHVQGYIKKIDVLEYIKPGGTFVLNTVWTNLNELESHLPSHVKKKIANLGLKFYVINATEIAHDVGLEGRINMIMQSVFFKLANVLPIEEALSLLKESIKTTFKKKGNDIINMNITAVNHTLENVIEIQYPSSWNNPNEVIEENTSQELPHFIREILQPCVSMKGHEIPTSTFLNYVGGAFPSGSSKYEKRGIATTIPEWDVDKCIQCNTCAFVCPHATIRPFLLSEDEVHNAPDNIKEIMQYVESSDRKSKGLYYSINITPLDCNGCVNCVENCPAEPKALEMKPMGYHLDRGNDKLWTYMTEQVVHKAKDLDLNKFSVKGAGFLYPYFEFHAACAGCGEASYVKLLSQLFGDRMVIANATGCSSVYSHYAPSTCYTTDVDGYGPAWSNSLFEDNAEFGLGIMVASTHQRNHMRVLAEQICSLESVEVNDDLKLNLQSWIDHFDDPSLSREYGNLVKDSLPQNETSNDLIERFKDGKNLLAKRSYWCIGGDGSAYDIGLGGLIHTLSSGENINVFILDTQVYSNTGGQSSKATPIGAGAKFANDGKGTRRMNLGLLAMNLGVFVASVAMGANKNHLLKTIKEAEAYDGPSLIIAYSPCIGHGFTSMRYTQQQEELAVKSGFWPLYRFNPDAEKKFSYDYKKIELEKVDEFMSKENRFKSVMRMNPEKAKFLHDQLKAHILERHEHLLSLEDIYNDGNEK